MFESQTLSGFCECPHTSKAIYLSLHRQALLCTHLTRGEMETYNADAD